MQWLDDHNIKAERVTSNGDFVGAIVKVSEAEALLNTSYSSFKHEATDVAVLRTTRPYSVPEEVAAHLDFVAPTVTFPPFHNTPKKSSLEQVTALKSVVTPAFLRAMYNMKETDVGNGTALNNTQAVASFIKQYYDPKDLKVFWAKYKPPAVTPYSDVGVQEHKAEVEASIDSEYISATGAGIPVQMWYTPGTQPGNPENEPFVDWLTTLSSTPDAPSVFSISYGDDENGVARDYALRCATEFQKAGLRGISLLAASGDSGAGCDTEAYVPTFPADCPWVTGVGGLQGGKAGQSPTGETVAGLSGGGFSNYFARPDFQDAAVAHYKTQAGLPAQKMWNASGAGFPDVSAQALQYDTCSGDFWYPYDGTSCASPTVAGLFAMLNNERVLADKQPLGFLNPLIYSDAGASFNDVSSGKNNYCDSPQAFPATKGWDAASGFGSPNYQLLKAKVLALP